MPSFESNLLVAKLIPTYTGVRQAVSATSYSKYWHLCSLWKKQHSLWHFLGTLL